MIFLSQRSDYGCHSDASFLSLDIGGGADWLQEHVRDNFLPAWSTPLPDGQLDAAIRVKALTRWNNFYVQARLFTVEV